jgi:recombinational DNA repair protein (RecF pathway)
MNSIALCADSMPATCRFSFKFLAVAGVFTLLTACAGVGTSVGISVPIGRAGGVGVSVGSGGTVSGSVGVGAGGGSVSVGASGQLPKPAEKKPDAEAEKKEEKKP